MNRRGRAVAAGMVLAAVVCAGALAPVETDAAWVDAEVGTSSGLAAGTVSPVVTMSCAPGVGILAPVTFSWSAPGGGLSRTGYRWTVTGALSGSSTLAANATSVSLGSGLLGIGTGTFSLYAVGPGGWESTPKTGTLSFLTGLLSSCSVP